MRRSLLLLSLVAALPLCAAEEKIHIIPVDLRTPLEDFRVTFENETTPRVQIPVKRGGFDVPEADLSTWTGTFYYAESDTSVTGMAVIATLAGSVFDVQFDASQVAPTGTYYAQLLFSRADGRVQEWRRGRLTIRGSGGAQSGTTVWNVTTVAGRVSVLETNLQGHVATLATTNSPGHVIVGEGLAITESGVLSTIGGSGLDTNAVHVTDPAYQNLLTNTATKAQGERADLALTDDTNYAKLGSDNEFTGTNTFAAVVANVMKVMTVAGFIDVPAVNRTYTQISELVYADGDYQIRGTFFEGSGYSWAVYTNLVGVYVYLSAPTPNAVTPDLASDWRLFGVPVDGTVTALDPIALLDTTSGRAVVNQTATSDKEIVNYGTAANLIANAVADYVPINRLLIVNGVTNDFADDIEITVESGGGVDTNAVLDLIDLADRDPYLIPYAASVTIAPSNGVLQAITNITGNLTLLWDTSSSNVDTTVLLLLPPTTNTVTLGQAGYEYVFVAPLASGGQNVSTNTVTELIMRKPYSTTNATVLVRQQGSSPAPFSPSNLSTDYADDYATLVKTDTAAYVNLLTNTATKAQGERADLALTDDTNYAKLATDNEFAGTNTFASVYITNTTPAGAGTGALRVDGGVYASNGVYSARGTAEAAVTGVIGDYIGYLGYTSEGEDYAGLFRSPNTTIELGRAAVAGIQVLADGGAMAINIAFGDYYHLGVKGVSTNGFSGGILVDPSNLVFTVDTNDWVVASHADLVRTNHTGDVSISGKLTAGSYPAKQTPYFLTGTNITVSADYMLQAITNITGATTINWPAGDATADMWISLTLPATTNTITLGSTNWVSYTFVSPLTSGGNNVGTNRPTRMILEQVHGSTNATVTVTESR
jgi:hypothetical protein